MLFVSIQKVEDTKGFIGQVAVHFHHLGVKSDLLNEIIESSGLLIFSSPPHSSSHMSSRLIASYLTPVFAPNCEFTAKKQRAQIGLVRMQSGCLPRFAICRVYTLLAVIQVGFRKGVEAGGCFKLTAVIWKYLAFHKKGGMFCTVPSCIPLYKSKSQVGQKQMYTFIRLKIHLYAFKTQKE